jgi:hypothetical protein
LRHRRVGAGDRAAPLTIHENRFLQARESGSDRPCSDLSLGEETDRLDAAKHQDLKPRHVICGNETRPPWRRYAPRENIQAEQGGERPAERDREPEAQRPAPPQRDPLQARQERLPWRGDKP